jgi:hypothetical protein
VASRRDPGIIVLLGVTALAWLSVPIASRVARAQAASSETSTRDPAEYQQVIGRAVREFEAGNYPEARAAFNRAHQLYPNARTHLGLGLTAFELRNYQSSIEHLEQALSSTVKPLNPKLRKSAEDVLVKARDLIGRVTLAVSPNAGRVLVDGVPVALIDGQALVLEVGDHTIEVQTPGYLPERRDLSIVGGEQVQLSVVLSKPEQAAGPVAAQSEQTTLVQPAPRRSDDGATPSRRRYKSPWLWIGVGTALVAGGVAAGLLLRPETKVEPGDPVRTDNTPPSGVVEGLRRW